MPIADLTDPNVKYENVAMIREGSTSLFSLYAQIQPLPSNLDPIPAGFQRFIFVYNENKSPLLLDGVTANPEFDFSKLQVISPIIEKPGAVFDWEPPTEDVLVVECYNERWYKHYGHPFDNGIIAVVSDRGDRLSIPTTYLAHFTARCRMAP
jgi:hypothetical protein